MLPSLLLVPLAVLHAASLTPSTLPAHGAAQAVLKVDAPGVVRLRASSAAGTSCELVDPRSGPIAQSGTTGRKNCLLEQFLDAGSYLVRVRSPRKGKGSVSLSAVRFEEASLDAQKTLPVLQPGVNVEASLAEEKQVSATLHLDQAGPVLLHVVGRTAGLVGLWRGGAFLEPLSFVDSTTSWGVGQPVHDWWGAAMLEAGDYRLTAYGANPLPWTQGNPDTHVVLSWGVAKGDSQGQESATLPASGFWGVQVSASSVAAFLTTPSEPSGNVEAGLWSTLGEDEARPFGYGTERCRIASGADWHECAVVSSLVTGHIVWVRGAPGTPFTLRWAPLHDPGDSSAFVSGSYTAPTSPVPFEPPAADDYLLAVDELPPSSDAAPLSCTVTKQTDDASAPIARDSPLLSAGTSERSFNYDGQNAILEFEVKTPGKYHLATSGQRKSQCELYALDGAAARKLTGGSKGCDLNVTLGAGLHQLTLHEGTDGIETFHATGPAGKAGGAVALEKTGCLFPRLHLETGAHALVMSRSASGELARGVHLRSLPLGLEQPLPLELTAGRKVSLPIQANQSFVVRVGRGKGLRCGWEGSPSMAVRDGVCALPPQPRIASLQLEAAGGEPVQLLLSQPSHAARASAPPARAVFRPAPLPALALGEAAAFAVDASPDPTAPKPLPQSHSVRFEVKEAGLYDVTTEGLLSMACTLSTPVQSTLAQATEGGRGRNCLIEEYLRPGEYRVTATAHSRSRGHALLRVTRQPELAAESLAPGQQAFFQVAAAQLVRESISVPSEGKYALSTVTTSGATLGCRLEDAAGWPLLKAPSSCEVQVKLAAGHYRWLQLPATVETQRRSSVQPVKKSELLTGNTVHPLELNQRYAAELGKDGKDEFTFALSGDASLSVLLTHGMAGRIYAADDLRATRVLATVPPTEDGEAPRPVGLAEESGGENDETAAPDDEAAPGSDGDSEESETASYNEDGNPTPPAPAAVAETLPQAPALPGAPVTLKGGRYRLITAHTQGDVAIRYSVQVGSAVLLPGMSRELPVPSRVPVAFPAAGIARLVTQGTTDVRCQLAQESAGVRQLLAESTPRGADWNCAMAQLLPAGPAVLTLESPSGLRGLTTVRLEVPPVQDATLSEKSSWTVADAVVRAPLPAASGDEVAWAELTADQPFSCALESSAGVTLSQQLDTQRCELRVASRGAVYRVRVWSSGKPVQVAGRAHVLSGGAVAKLSVPRKGLYKVEAGAQCVDAGSGGPLRACGPEISLDAGPYLFTSGQFGKGAPGGVREQVAQVDRPVSEQRPLSTTGFVQNQASSRPALHLLSVLPPAAMPAPACELSGGVTEHSSMGCFAVSGVTRESQTSASSPAAHELADVVQRSLLLPAPVALPAGPQSLRWKTPVQRWTLPTSPFRLEVTLLPDAWGVQLDGAGHALTLCPPREELNRCNLFGNGGELVLYSPREQRAESELSLLESLPPPHALAELDEETFTSPGVTRFQIEAAPRSRRLEIQGAASCGLERSDGVHEARCSTTLEAGQTARLWVQHTAAPLRVTLGSDAERDLQIAGKAPPASGAPWPADHGLNLGGAALERSIQIDTEQVFALSADSGVCSLWNDQGLLAANGEGLRCDLERVLAPGRYRVRVRPFGSSALRGTAGWSSRAVESLKEGVASERWAAPGEVRFFRFSTLSPGKVGLGLQSRSDDLDCTVLDARQRPLGDGCQQLLELPQGSFLLTVRAPREGPPQRFRPVLLGLSGAKTVVPREYLEAFFERLGQSPGERIGQPTGENP